MSKTISETIREAMIATGQNDLQISRQVGVSQPQLHYFRKGSNPKASTIDALAAWLGFTLVQTEQAPPKRSSRRKTTASNTTRKHPPANKERENESERL